MRRRSVRTLLAVLALAGAALAVPAAAVPASASPAAAGPAAPTGAAPAVERSCGAPKPGELTCYALRRVDQARAGVTPNAGPSGYGPADLQDAYDLPSATNGDGQTVAIVDAYDNPNAEADLAVYRAQYGLPPCTTENGCFRRVNEVGDPHPESPDPGWGREIALDLDMVSAACPRCNILLVEAHDAAVISLGRAVDTAVRLGAKVVSNSYGTGYTSEPGSGEPSELLRYDPSYNHPGVAIVASSGDSAYGVSWPASSPTVLSVGGTSLQRDAGTKRGWSESVWNNDSGGGGSGCSVLEPKPSFQRDSGCSNRTVADVAAVGDPYTGVAVYDSYGSNGWVQMGGTSAGSPLIAATYALAGTPQEGSAPNSFPYAADAGALNDVTTGSNGSCDPAYLCTAGPGYDGPTGLGTPHGVAAFDGRTGIITGHVTEAGTGAPLEGIQVSAAGKVSRDVLTDANGEYSLTVLVGEYDVTIGDYTHDPHAVPDVEIADGGTVTIDAELVKRPTGTVSGTVTDGSGHGWPLYARITVDGVPGPPVYTDPYTGRYRMQLPQRGTFTLRATPVARGYQVATSDVLVVESTTRDLTAGADPNTCAAPGYRAGTSPAQGFDGSTAPDGWTTSTLTGASWRFDDPYQRGNHTGGSGGFAIVDVGRSPLTTGAYLISPPVDLTGAVVPQLSFDMDDTGPGLLSIDASSDGGSTWHSVWASDSSKEKLVGPLHQQLALPQSLAKPGVQVRFGYVDYANGDNWWAIDNVALWDARCEIVPGGLVSGTVTDQNTGRPLDAARVSAGPDASAVSAPLDDPEHEHGFYVLFAPHVGATTLTTAAARYQPTPHSVQVAADAVTRADIALAAGRVQASKPSIASTVDLGTVTAGTVTLTNDGSAPAHVTLGEGNQPATAAAGAPLQRTRVTNPAAVLTGSATASSKAAAAPAVTENSAWTDGSDYPMPNPASTMSAYDSDDGKVYTLGWSFYDGIEDQKFYVYDPTSQVWTPRTAPPIEVGFAAIGYIDGKIVVAGGLHGNQAIEPIQHTVADVQIYDPATDTWTTGADLPAPRMAAGSTVLDGQLYVVGGCAGELGCAAAPTVADVFRYDVAHDRWTTLTDYPARENALACAAVRGEIVCAGGVSGAWGADPVSSRATHIYNPAVDRWSKGSDLPIDLYLPAYTSAAGQLVVAGGLTAQGSELTNQAFAYQLDSDSWTTLPNANHPIFGGSATCGLVTVGVQENEAFAPVRTQHLAGYGDCGDGADTPWLVETPTSVDVPAGHSVRVSVTFDASAVTQPGVYTARLNIATDTPYPTAPVTATMTVRPPKHWGELSGVVRGKSCDGTVRPLAGASVQVDTWASHYTLTTDASGHYSVWLDKRNNPLTVLASRDGWHAQSRTVRIKANATTIADFTLATTLTCS